MSWGMLPPGSSAPDFEAPDQTGRPRTLAELTAEGPIVLYFYPRDFTPVCTAEACLFRDAAAELAATGARVVGVSADPPESHARFAARHGLSFPLLSDQDGRLQSLYQARMLLGLMARRVTYVISADRRIVGGVHSELSAARHLEAVRRLLGTIAAPSP